MPLSVFLPVPVSGAVRVLVLRLFAPWFRRARAIVPMLLTTLACAQASLPAADTAALDAALRAHRIVLLGEVHDSPAQHALRAAALDRWIASGARPAILMEQFDRDHQLDIDAARAAPGATADSVIAAGAPPGSAAARGWDWAFYRPYVALALEHGLPLVAVNVSREDARRLIAEGLDTDGFDTDVPADIQAAQAAAIVAGHCGKIDRPAADRLVVAQVARDQYMAHAIEQHAARGAVLLAGNGHVRRDIGVPRWLAPETRRDAVAIGLVEAGEGVPQAAFDRTLVTPAAARDDPCAAFR